MPSVYVVQTGQVDAPGSTTAPASPWEVMTSPDPSSVTDYLNGVSCVQQFCMAVGNQGAHGGIGPLAETWDGATWEVVPMLDPSASGAANGLPQLTLVNAVSCASPSFCVAIGESNFTGRWTTLAERWDGASWSRMPSGDTPAFEDYLLGVACPSTISCTAVGSYTNGHAGQLNGTLVETMGAGRSFSIVASADQAFSLGHLSTPANHLFSISCPVPGTFCASVGYSQNETTDGAALPRQALAESSGGGAWSLQQAAGPGVSNQVNSVSCASATSCTAVGWSDTAGDVQPLIESWAGQTWSTVGAPAGGTSLDGVSCLDTGPCTAVGHHGLVDSWDGKTWSVVPTPQEAGTSRNLHAVSCTSGTCTAVGAATGSGTTTTLIEQACSATSGGAPEAASAVREQAPMPSLETTQIARTQTTTDKCHLKVSITVGKTCLAAIAGGPPSGTMVPCVTTGLSFKQGDSYQTGALFVAEGAPLEPGSGVAQGSPHCVSGCADLVIKVTDNNGQPVTDATLQASVTAVPESGLPPYPAGSKPTRGYLCDETDHYHPVCGTFLPGLATSDDFATDKAGELDLQYWVPGVVQSENVTVTVKAEEECTKKVCPALKRKGEQSKTILVLPDELIKVPKDPRTTVDLSTEAQQAMVKWTESGASGALTNLLSDHFLEELGKGLIEFLTDSEVPGGPLPGLAKAAFEAFSDAQKVEQEFTALVLPELLRVAETGLGDTSTNRATNEEPDAFVQDAFLSRFAGDGFKSGAVGGTLFKLAKRLLSIGTRAPEHLSLNVFEVSYCEPGSTDGTPAKGPLECAPGYYSSYHGLFGGKNIRLAGIHPFLYFQFTAERAPELNTIYDSFVIPYNAVDWMEAQFGPRK